MKVKKTIAVAALAAGTALVAVPALAQDDAPDTDDGAVSATPERHHRRHAGAATLAEALGLDVADLHERLHDGETVADIAAAQGVAIGDVIDVLVSSAEQRLAAAVDNERLTREEADRRLADIEERITAMVNGEIDVGPHHRHHGPRGLRLGYAVADLLGLDGPELMEQLRAGATLADIAADQGVSVDDLAAAIMAPIVERLEQAVAAGGLTRGEADATLTRIEARVDELIDGDLPLRDRGFGPGTHRRPGAGSGPGVSGAPTNA